MYTISNLFRLSCIKSAPKHDRRIQLGLFLRHRIHGQAHRAFAIFYLQKDPGATLGRVFHIWKNWTSLAHWQLKTNCKLQSYWMLLVYSINECSFLDAAGCKHCASHDRKIQPGSALQWSFLVQRHLVRGNTRLWITSAKPRRSSYMLQPYSP